MTNLIIPDIGQDWMQKRDVYQQVAKAVNERAAMAMWPSGGVWSGGNIEMNGKIITNTELRDLYDVGEPIAQSGYTFWNRCLAKLYNAARHYQDITQPHYAETIDSNGEIQLSFDAHYDPNNPPKTYAQTAASTSITDIAKRLHQVAGMIGLERRNEDAGAGFPQAMPASVDHIWYRAGDVVGPWMIRDIIRIALVLKYTTAGISDWIDSSSVPIMYETNVNYSGGVQTSGAVFNPTSLWPTISNYFCNGGPFNSAWGQVGATVRNNTYWSSLTINGYDIDGQDRASFITGLERADSIRFTSPTGLTATGEAGDRPALTIFPYAVVDYPSGNTETNPFVITPFASTGPSSGDVLEGDRIEIDAEHTAVVRRMFLEDQKIIDNVEVCPINRVVGVRVPKTRQSWFFRLVNPILVMRPSFSVTGWI